MRKDNALLMSAAVFFLSQTLLFAGELSSSTAAKLDPRLRLLVQQPQFQKGLLIKAGALHTLASGERIILLVKTKGTGEEISANGGRVLAMIGDIAVVETPIERLESLANLPSVVYLEASKQMKFSNDTGTTESRGKAARQQFNLSGRNVLVGVIDSGIDWRHDDFRTAQGQTRIKYILDLSQGGAVYTEAQINAALSGSGTVSAADRNGHGSHVMGTAAGNGRATGANIPAGTYAGMAPEADLVAIKSQNGDNGTISEADAIRGMKFIDSVAAVLGKPYVINLSFGGHSGAHDGTSLQEQAIDNLVGAGKSGKVIVASAGNDGDENIHAGGTLNSGSVTIDFNLPSFTAASGTQNDYVQIEAWYSGAANLSFRLTAPNNAQYTANSGVRFGQDTPNGAVIIDNASAGVNPFNGDKEVLMQIFDFSSNVPAAGTWRLTISGTAARYDLWLTASTMGASLTSNIDVTRTLTLPGTAKNVITVGAWDTKKFWTDLDGNQLQNPSAVVNTAGAFSGNGPTRDGRIKPEISAPGRMIASTLSANASPSGQFSVWKGTATFPNAYILRDNRHAIGLGTSFAAPNVAGGIALMLERNPSFDAIQIRNMLSGTAKNDGFTGATPNNKWGYGKVDFVAALTTTAVANPETGGQLPQKFSLLPNYPNPFNPATVISFQVPGDSEVSLAIYNTSGQLVKQLANGNFSGGSHSFIWNATDARGVRVASGVYLYVIKAVPAAGSRQTFIAQRKLVLLK